MLRCNVQCADAGHSAFGEVKVILTVLFSLFTGIKRKNRKRCLVQFCLGILPWDWDIQEERANCGIHEMKCQLYTKHILETECNERKNSLWLIVNQDDVMAKAIPQL